MSFERNPKRIIISFIAILGMGFFLSFLIMCNFGTDPYTFMNLSISDKIGPSLGNWQLILNVILLILVFIFNKKLIGFGTIFNMVLIGYYADFFTWAWFIILPGTIFTEDVSRVIIFVIALFGFIVSVSVYINADMGVSPFDGIPIIITDAVLSKFPKVPRALIRMCWDGSAILVGWLFGGKPTIGIFLMAIFLGPMISIVAKLMERYVWKNGNEAADKKE